jgi:ribosomal-protein-alanine N-acetyltransferase
MPSFAGLELTTPRLVLRPLAEADAEPLFGIFSDARVMRYWSSAPWTSVATAHDVVAVDRAALAAGEHLRLGIERAADRALIGVCTLFAFVPQCRRAEVGYALAPHAWGSAYMDEALRALLRHGFGELALNRVEADIDPRNEASARSLERLGFQREGLLRERWIVGGEVADTALYGLLQRVWHWRQ